MATAGLPALPLCTLKVFPVRPRVPVILQLLQSLGCALMSSDLSLIHPRANPSPTNAKSLFISKAVVVHTFIRST